MVTHLKLLRLMPIVVALMITTPGCDTSGDRSVSAANGGSSASTETAKLEMISVLALGPADGRAVVALPDGKMQVVKVGDTVPGTQATVIQVLHDKLVIEDTIEQQAGDPPVKQMVWLYKRGKAGEKSRIQRLDQVGPEKPLVQRPANGVAE